MCTGSRDTPAPAPVKEKALFIRNPYLDEKENSDGLASRTDRASLMIPTDTGIGFEGRGGTGGGTRGVSIGGATSTGARRRSAGDLTIAPSPSLAGQRAPTAPGLRNARFPTPTGSRGQVTMDDIIGFATSTRNRDGSPKTPPPTVLN